MNNLAFLFPGQGSQFVGMGKQFWNDFVLAKRLFEEASDAISLDVKKLCFNGDMNELTKTMNAQPAILTVSVIAFQVYMQEIGVEPRFLAGHSLGEYSALVCAGALSFSGCRYTCKGAGNSYAKCGSPAAGDDGRRDTALSPNVAGNMFESIDGRLSGRCSLHEFRTAACDFRTPASCGTCHQDGGGKGCGIHLFECQCAFSQFDDTISLRTIPDCFTPVFLPGCRMADHFKCHRAPLQQRKFDQRTSQAAHDDAG